MMSEWLGVDIDDAECVNCNWKAAHSNVTAARVIRLVQVLSNTTSCRDRPPADPR